MMKYRLFIIVVMLSVMPSNPNGYAAQNPSLSNPAGATTTPQSYIRSSVVDTSNTIDTSGNQIVTGNVRRGMHFRGNVPYSSPSSFNATLGSSSLNSFMRDSAGAEDISRTRNASATGSRTGTNYQSYYLPSSTVTTMSQSRTGLQTSQSYEAHTQSRPAVSNWNTSERSPALWQLYNPGLAGTQNNTTQMRYAPSSPRLNQQQSQDGFGQYRPDNEVTYQQYRQQTQTNPDTTKSPNNYQYSYQYTENQIPVTSRQTDSLMQRSQQTAVPGTPPSGVPDGTYAEQTNQWQQSPNTLRYGTEDSSMRASRTAAKNMSQYVPPQKGYQTLATGEFDRYSEQTSLSAYSPGTIERPASRSVNTSYQTYTDSGTTAAQKYQQQISRYPTAQAAETTQALAQIQRQLDDLMRSIDSSLETSTADTSYSIAAGQDSPERLRTGKSYSTGRANQPVQTDNSSKDSPSAFADINRLSQTDISAGANHISRYPDYESYSQSKYNQLYRAAEGHLNLGRFYQAADTFSLAAIYKPEDPFCYAGRGHALFAAGEYVSGALHLIRAIELDPEYLKNQIDLAELMGGPEKLESRIADLSKWLQKSDAPGLGFLLGYVYYHTGRLSEANQVMQVVMQEMPHSKAAMALKTTIDFKLSNQK
jgi:tetratricopeptide (TPR) repeat protein